MVLRGCLALRHSCGWRATPAAWWLYVPGGAAGGSLTHQHIHIPGADFSLLTSKFTSGISCGDQNLTLAAKSSIHRRAVPRLHGRVHAGYGGGVKLGQFIRLLAVGQIVLLWVTDLVLCNVLHLCRLPLLQILRRNGWNKVWPLKSSDKIDSKCFFVMFLTLQVNSRHEWQ